MILRLTASCNNRCFFCLVDDEIASTSARPTAELLGLLDATPPGEIVDIFGGEPTIDPSFWTVLEHALSTGRIVTLASNIRVFSHEPAAARLARLADERLVVRTTLMAHLPALHDELNGAPRAFGQTIAGLRNLSRAGFCVSTNVVILRQNVDHLLATGLCALEAGSVRIKFSGAVRTAKFRDSIPDPAVVRRMLDEVVPELERRGAQVSIEKLPLCVAGVHVARTQPEADAASPVSAWFARRGPCERCALRTACPGGERGALERFGDRWMVPFDAVPPDCTVDVPFTHLSAYQPPAGVRFVRADLDTTDVSEVLAAVEEVAAFKERHGHVELITS